MNSVYGLNGLNSKRFLLLIISNFADICYVLMKRERGTRRKEGRGGKSVKEEGATKRMKK